MKRLNMGRPSPNEPVIPPFPGFDFVLFPYEDRELPLLHRSGE
jgi:hypothetical protein